MWDHIHCQDDTPHGTDCNLHGITTIYKLSCLRLIRSLDVNYLQAWVQFSIVSRALYSTCAVLYTHLWKYTHDAWELCKVRCMPYGHARAPHIILAATKDTSILMWSLLVCSSDIRISSRLDYCYICLVPVYSNVTFCIVRCPYNPARVHNQACWASLLQVPAKNPFLHSQ